MYRRAWSTTMRKVLMWCLSHGFQVHPLQFLVMHHTKLGLELLLSMTNMRYCCFWRQIVVCGCWQKVHFSLKAWVSWMDIQVISNNLEKTWGQILAVQAKNGDFRETEIWEVPTGLLNQVCCTSYDDYFACFEFKYTLITCSHMWAMHYGKFCRMCCMDGWL